MRTVCRHSIRKPLLFLVQIVSAVALALAFPMPGALAAASNAPSVAPPPSEAAASPPERPGRFRKARERVDDDTYQKLIGLGYLQGYAKAPVSSGVTLFVPEKTQRGVNLVVSGHSPSAQILDLAGRELHAWRYKKAREIWPDFDHPEAGLSWRRAFVYPNGDLLAIYEYAGIIKLDKNSKLLWAHRGVHHAHHDLEVTPNGLIYVLTAQKRVIPRLSKHEILDEFITVLAPNGAVLKEHSLFDLIARSEYASLLKRGIVRSGGFWGHVLHSNTLEVFDGSQAHLSPLYRKGNVLISILMMDTIAIADLNAGKLVWAWGRGELSRQHQPTLLDDGHLLVFDNRRNESCSRVIELDPASEEIVWQYNGCVDEAFYSATCGTAQRLANGNTLITETDNGRAFEVTHAREIVWEYWNPQRVGEQRELIASLLEVVRLDRRTLPFLKGTRKRPAVEPN